MQPIDLSQFPNISGWHVKHDPDNHLYTIKNERGRVLDVQFTDRRFAEIYLANYLDTIHRKAAEQAEKKKASGNKQTSTSDTRVSARA